MNTTAIVDHKEIFEAHWKRLRFLLKKVMGSNSNRRTFSVITIGDLCKLKFVA